jgi:regulator of sigma E protease
MTQVLTGFLVVAAVVLLFGAAVFVHEFGHYWMARRRGLKVEAFAIGFGPKILSWTRDGIEYSWRWIPAGGFVRLPQMATSEALEGSPEGEPIPPASPWSKILVAFAGPFMNVVFALGIATLLYFTGLPVPVNPPIVGYVDPQSPEAKAGVQQGDVVVSVDGKPVKSWQDVQTETILARTNVLPVVLDRKGASTTYQLAAQVSEALGGLKTLNLDPQDHPEVLDVTEGGAAKAAGLQSKDIILNFAGVPIYSREQLIDLIKKRPGQATEITVQRGQEKRTLTLTPKLEASEKVGRIGVVLGSSSTIVYRVQRPGPTPWANLHDVWDKTVSILFALVHSKQTGVRASDLSGPVGILGMLALWVKTDYRLALNFLVLLNVNLAVLNLLPVPVLDGGHILLALVERIRRRPLSARLVEYTTTAFAVLLISLMLYVTFFDLKRISVFKSMFKRDAQIEQVDKPADAPAR